jgi:hypothetical protein
VAPNSIPTIASSLRCQAGASVFSYFLSTA